MYVYIFQYAYIVVPVYTSKVLKPTRPCIVMQIRYGLFIWMKLTRARDANESMIKLTQSIWMAVRGDSVSTAAPTHATTWVHVWSQWNTQTCVCVYIYIYIIYMESVMYVYVVCGKHISFLFLTVWSKFLIKSMYVCVHVCVRVQTCIHIHTNAYMHTSTCIYVHKSIFIHHSRLRSC